VPVSGTSGPASTPRSPTSSELAGARIEGGVPVVVCPRSNLVVPDGHSDDLTGVRNPVRAIVRRAGLSDVSEVVLQ